MATFKHKNGGITNVFTKVNIDRLKADKNFTEVLENAPSEVLEVKEQKEVQNVEVEIEPLQ